MPSMMHDTVLVIVVVILIDTWIEQVIRVTTEFFGVMLAYCETGCQIMNVFYSKRFIIDKMWISNCWAWAIMECGENR